MAMLLPPLKPMFSGRVISTAPGAAAVTSAIESVPVPLSTTMSGCAGNVEPATARRHRITSPPCPQCTTAPAARGAGRAAIASLAGRGDATISADLEVLRARIGQPLGQRGCLLVLVGDDGRNVRPRDAERGIVPEDAALASGAV